MGEPAAEPVGEPVESVHDRVWRHHQRGALAAIDQDHATKTARGHHSRSWVVLPPGAGKTYVGVDVARRALAAGEVEQVVVLTPNTAIQGQWVRSFADFGLTAGTSRRLDHDVVVLTYQSVAVFGTGAADAVATDGGADARAEQEDPDDPDIDPDIDPDEAGDPDDAEDPGHPDLLARLHPNGSDLVARLAEAGPLLLVLDECHHLLELWGELLLAMLEHVGQARVLGLTATPQDTLNRRQAEVVRDLFGRITYATTVPAVVREGDLAPFAELAWFTTPTPAEQAWLDEGATRFTELSTLLLDPTVVSTPFLTWLERRFVEPAGAAASLVTWNGLALSEPELTDAVLRLSYGEMLALPEGAVLREEHRRPPSADDWMLLVDDWLRRSIVPSDDPVDAGVLDAVRAALPSVGRVWTRNGIRRGRSTVDRVLARSEAKADACVEIVGHEASTLLERLRMLVLCDHESAAATVPFTLAGVVDAKAGSAWAILDRLLADPVSHALRPVLVTGRTVAGDPTTMADLASYVTSRDPGLGATLEVRPVPADDPASGSVPAARLVGTTGAWRSRRWVPHVTAFFEEGRCRVLVGTRGLLGEGWDARRVTGIVDLTSSTTSTSVVQTRGRSLRLDPRWPEKVAVNWTVTCVAPGHPRGDADWQRLVRKHDGFYGVDETGDVVDGVAHLDPQLSPYAPPAADELDGLNARAVLRSQDRDEIRARWRVGEPYDDLAGTALRLRSRATGGLGAGLGDQVGRREVAVTPQGLRLPDRTAVAAPRREGPVTVAAAVGTVAVLVLAWWAIDLVGVAGAVVLAAVGLGVVGTLLGVRRVAAARARDERARDLLAEARRPVSVHQVAAAVADGLHASGLVSHGAASLTVDVDPTGTYRCQLLHVDEGESQLFADALEEAVGPLRHPRYVVQRHVLAPEPPEGDPAEMLRRAARGDVRPDGAVWHAVPTVLGVNTHRAHAYGDAWAHWVGGARTPLYTGSAEGAGILTAQHGSDPFSVTAVMRRHWA